MVDVSECMQEVTFPYLIPPRNWISSIFATIDNLIKNDVNPSNKVFAIGCGAKHKPRTFDILGTLKTAQLRHILDAIAESERLDEILESILNTLEEGGAPYVRSWANVNQLMQVVSLEQATIIRAMLNIDSEFKQNFVDSCLPMQCKERNIRRTILAVMLLGRPYISWANAINESIREAVHKGLSLVWKVCAPFVGPKAVMGVRDASGILHGSTEDQSLTAAQADRLMKTADPFVHGSTPLLKALKEARDLFAEDQYTTHRKLLFVLSDGQPTDGQKEECCPYFEDLGVDVMCCYITKEILLDPKRLYSCQLDSEERARFMFNLSTSVSTLRLPMTIFVKPGFTVDVIDNQTKLFCKVDHPTLIEEFCTVAREMVCSQDSLVDTLSSVFLDLYINQASDEFGAKRQIGGTCCANAAAAVMYLAMKRIVARKGGYPDFVALRDRIIEIQGIKGANIAEVLQEYCPAYGLHCETIGIEGALQAVASKRAVLAMFALTDPEWERFSEFFENSPKGILTESHLGKSKRDPKMELKGHAVVLTSFNSYCLRLMNSWGTDWADQGFFRVRNSDVLDTRFIDVYWTMDDMFESEVEAYKLEGPTIEGKLVRSLTGLRTATFRCPLCGVTSKVTEYTGQLIRACCPCCQGDFDCAGSETNDLVLSMYLTSLCD